MKKYSLFIIFTILALLFAGCGNSANTNSAANEPGSGKEKEKYVLKLAHSQPTAAVLHQNTEWLKEELEKRSNGRLSLEIYPASQLMPGDQEMPALVQGQVDMVHSYSSITGGFDPIWYFFDLPFLFDYDPKDPSSYIENRRKFLNSEEGGLKIAKMMEEKGVKLLAVDSVDTYASYWTRDKNKVITDIASAEGLKTRTAGGPISNEILKSIKGSGISIPGVELPTALQQGVVDGMITVPLYVYENKLPVKNLTLYPLVNYVMPLFISQKAYDSLPADLQQILVETAKDLDTYSDQMVTEEMGDLIERLDSELGIKTYFPTEQEITEWQEATKPVWDFYLKMEPRAADLIEEVNRLREENK